MIIFSLILELVLIHHTVMLKKERTALASTFANQFRRSTPTQIMLSGLMCRKIEFLLSDISQPHEQPKYKQTSHFVTKVLLLRPLFWSAQTMNRPHLHRYSYNSLRRADSIEKSSKITTSDWLRSISLLNISVSICLTLSVLVSPVSFFPELTWLTHASLTTWKNCNFFCELRWHMPNDLVQIIENRKLNVMIMILVKVL